MDSCVKTSTGYDFDFYTTVMKSDLFNQLPKKYRLEETIVAVAKMYWDLQDEYKNLYGGEYQCH